jgi:hypothetical protein
LAEAFDTTPRKYSASSTAAVFRPPPSIPNSTVDFNDEHTTAADEYRRGLRNASTPPGYTDAQGRHHLTVVLARLRHRDRVRRERHQADDPNHIRRAVAAEVARLRRYRE